MGKILVKETITKEREIEITVDTLLALIDDLALKEKRELFKKLSSALKGKKPLELMPFKKDRIENIISDFADTNLYEENFFRDLEEGLKRSSIYK